MRALVSAKAGSESAARGRDQDLPLTAIATNVRPMTRPDTRTPPAGAYKAALILGVVAATVDLLVGPVQVASALIVIFAFMLALAYPTRAWQWAVLVGIITPFAHLIAGQLGYANPARPDNFYISYLSLIPAFIGAYSAVLLRKFAARQEKGGK